MVGPSPRRSCCPAIRERFPRLACSRYAINRECLMWTSWTSLQTQLNCKRRREGAPFLFFFFFFAILPFYPSSLFWLISIFCTSIFAFSETLACIAFCLKLHRPIQRCDRKRERKEREGKEKRGGKERTIRHE